MSGRNVLVMLGLVKGRTFMSFAISNDVYMKDWIGGGCNDTKRRVKVTSRRGTKELTKRCKYPTITVDKV